MLGYLTWYEDKKTGKGMFCLLWENGSRECIEHPEPIIAGRFGLDDLDRDGDTVFVTDD